MEGERESVGKWPRSKCEKFICESKMVINIYLSFCFICLDYGQKILNGIKKNKKNWKPEYWKVDGAKK